jgi:hypothetical protein
MQVDSAPVDHGDMRGAHRALGRRRHRHGVVGEATAGVLGQVGTERPGEHHQAARHYAAVSQLKEGIKDLQGQCFALSDYPEEAKDVQVRQGLLRTVA